MRRILSLVFISGLLLQNANAQLLTPEKTVYTHADSLRGSITPERAWWNLLKYEITVIPDYSAKTVSGENSITMQALTDGQVLQIDLQEPMKLTAATWKKKPLTYTREGNVFHIKFPKKNKNRKRRNDRLEIHRRPCNSSTAPLGRRLDLDQRCPGPALDDGCRRRPRPELLAAL